MVTGVPNWIPGGIGFQIGPKVHFPGQYAFAGFDKDGEKGFVLFIKVRDGFGGSKEEGPTKAPMDGIVKAFVGFPCVPASGQKHAFFGFGDV